MRFRVVNRTTTEREESLAALHLYDGDVCYAKKSYMHRNDARAAAKELAHRMGRDTAVYKCPVCHFYHITKDTGADA